MIKAQVTLWSGQDLDSLAAIESSGTRTNLMSAIGLMFRVTNAGGNASVKIEYALSKDGVTYTSYDTVVDAATATTWAGNSPEGWHQYAITFNAAPYIKFKVTDLATLNNNVVDAVLVFSEETSGGWAHHG